MRCCFFYHTDRGQNIFFFALFKRIILQFFRILQDKLHSFNNQDKRSMRLLCTKYFRAVQLTLENKGGVGGRLGFFVKQQQDS